MSRGAANEDAGRPLWLLGTMPAAPYVNMASERSNHVDAPAVLATATALPENRYQQNDLVDLALEVIPDIQVDRDVLRKFFVRVGVDERFLALPANQYHEMQGMEARSHAWLEVASELGEKALLSLFQSADVAPQDVGELMTTTVTGVAVPTLDARLMNRIPFASDLKRVPSFGLGCVGGAAGVARVADYLQGHRDELAVLLSVELCSLTVQQDDLSIANLISMGLFGDGAAAVLLAGPDHPRAKDAKPRVLDSRSVFFPHTEEMMGCHIIDSGFKVVLSPEVPELAREALPDAVDGFLGDHGLVRDDIQAWVTHPGGPKIIDAVEEGLDLHDGELEPARQGLAHVGNLSSASVLFLLDDYRRRLAPPDDAYGLMVAMGPAFCAELVLLQW